MDAVSFAIGPNRCQPSSLFLIVAAVIHLLIHHAVRFFAAIPVAMTVSFFFLYLCIVCVVPMVGKGIVPAKAAKMAEKSVTLMTEKLINIKVR